MRTLDDVGFGELEERVPADHQLLARSRTRQSLRCLASLRTLVAVSVADEGRGVPSERLPGLFRKFSRIEAEDQGGDTGLGLAICKGIVEAHGGRIWAESDGPGQGARFSCCGESGPCATPAMRRWCALT